MEEVDNWHPNGLVGKEGEEKKSHTYYSCDHAIVGNILVEIIFGIVC